VAVVGQYLVLNFLLPLLNPILVSLPTGIAGFIRFILASTAAYTAIFALGLYWFEKQGWRKLHPSVYFAGEWRTEYSYDIHDLRANRKPAEVAIGTATVFQSLLKPISVHGTFEIGDEKGMTKAVWRSRMFEAQVDDGGRVSVFVVYESDRKGYGPLKSEIVRGIEELNVTLDNRTHLPVEMTGTFYTYHETPLRRGQVRWCRISSQ